MNALLCPCIAEVEEDQIEVAAEEDAPLAEDAGEAAPVTPGMPVAMQLLLLDHLHRRGESNYWCLYADRHTYDCLSSGM